MHAQRPIPDPYLREELGQVGQVRRFAVDETEALADHNTPTAEATTVTDREADQVRAANATGLTPVVFVHGLWLLPSSWDRWAAVFEEAGFTAVTPGWPDDPETVEDANANPEVFAGK